MIQNLHTHTTFCDGKSTAEELVLAAIAQGMDSLGFSGHSYLPADPSWNMSPAATAAYRAEVLRLKEQYAGKLEIFLGLEQDYDSPAMAERYDYVIGSVHYVEKAGRLFCVDDSEEILSRAASELYGGDYMALAEDYFARVADVPRKTDAQILGHLDLITKFNEGDRLFPTTGRYFDAAAAAIESLAQTGVLFEINTGAISRGYRTAPYPSAALLRFIREKGGRILLSSDCHHADALLCAFEASTTLAKSCGFTEAMILTRDGFIPQLL